MRIDSAGFPCNGQPASNTEFLTTPYEGKHKAENDEIADWLLRLTDSHRNWGFGLCYLYLRNVKGFGWNHKRIYRIYRELELNLRIKPRGSVRFFVGGAV